MGRGDNPKYCGLEPIDQFLDRMDQDVPEDQRIPLLDITTHGNTNKVVESALPSTKRLGGC